MPLSRYGRAQTSESEATDEEGGFSMPDRVRPLRALVKAPGATSKRAATIRCRHGVTICEIVFDLLAGPTKDAPAIRESS
jgi:hypothetical protein